MKLEIKKQVLTRLGLTLGEYLYLLSLSYTQDNLKEPPQSTLHKKGLLADPTIPYDKHPKAYFKTIEALRKEGMMIGWTKEVRVSNIGLNEPKGFLKDIKDIAKEMKEIYPKGKKPGTLHYWTEGTPIIEQRLRKFAAKFGSNYTKEEILDATRRYVSSFKGDYSYMRILKYFIFKDSDEGTTSDLINSIENKEEDNNQSKFPVTNEWGARVL